MAFIPPMLLTEQKAPFDDPGWLFEIKFDGYRLQAECHAGSVRLFTRTGADATAWFPEVARGLSGLSTRRTVIDGEVCVLDDVGRSDFDRLHARALTRRFKPGADAVVFCAFDVLVAGGRDVMSQPIERRKTKLAALLKGGTDSVLAVTGIEGEGRWLFQQALGLKLEGIVAKRLGSTYAPGERSADWIKIKRKGAVPAQRFNRRAATP